MSAGRCFHSGYRETIRLADQRPLHVRLIRPTDKSKLAEAFHHLSAESRYCRFLSHKNALTSQELSFFTECDGIDHLALGAFEPAAADFQGDGALVGIARLIRCQDRPTRAEFALAVIDACQGLGLGRLLLERLRAAAVEFKIHHLEGQLLPHNQKVQRLLHRSSPAAVFRNDNGLVSVLLPAHAGAG
jgi:GNAT superfamily N-acetyltransferase